MPIVIDIDGTLANNDHRSHFIEKQEPADWTSFLRADLVAKDVPIEKTKRALQKLVELKSTIVFLTGRNEGLREVTKQWLFEHYDLDVKDEQLIMRPVGNMLNATQFKGEKIPEILRDFGSEAVFIDDDKYMHAVYERFGIALKAPECWDVMFPEFKLDPESYWRK